MGCEPQIVEPQPGGGLGAGVGGGVKVAVTTWSTVIVTDAVSEPPLPSLIV